MDDERIEFGSLPREEPPPADLESEIVIELRRARLLRPPGRKAAYAAAALIVTMGAIFGIVRLRHPSAENQQQYLLLLYESPRLAGGSRAEYSAWAREMRPLVAGGEELDRRILFAAGGEPPSNARVAGYFLIRAPNDATAERVARTCPHLKHGGIVVLRRIVI